MIEVNIMNPDQTVTHATYTFFLFWVAHYVIRGGGMGHIVKQINVKHFSINLTLLYRHIYYQGKSTANVLPQTAVDIFGKNRSLKKN